MKSIFDIKISKIKAQMLNLAQLETLKFKLQTKILRGLIFIIRYFRKLSGLQILVSQKEAY